MNRHFRLLISSLLILLIAACGGGGSLEREPSTPGGGGSGNDNTTLTVSMSIASQQGEDTNQLNADTPLLVSATVTNAAGKAVKDELVTFTFSQPDLATFNNDTGTALTNSEGVAQIGIVVADKAGDGLVTGTVKSGESANVGFKSAGIKQATVEPASLDLFVGALQLPSSGNDSVELIAVVKNAQNGVMQGVEVLFSVDNRASLSATVVSTEADGTARVQLSTSNEPENRTINITARTGTFVQQSSVEVVGTAITISGPDSIISGSTETYSLLVADSDGVGIAGAQVALTASNGTLSQTSVATDSKGIARVDFVSAASGQASIQASALNAQGALKVQVQADSFVFTQVPANDVALGADATLQITWLQDGTPVAGGNVSFSSSRGKVISADSQTNAAGQALLTLRSDNAGIASISAEGSLGQTQVSARQQIEFVATDAERIDVDATPDLIGPGGQQSTISAIVRDPAGNLVKGKTIEFNLNDVSGGFIEPAIAKTDSNGIATSVYQSQSTSNLDAVIVTATVQDEPEVKGLTTLTVNRRAFDIVIGTGQQLQVPDDSSYVKEFAVFVTDSAGNPVQGVDLSVSAVPVKFSQGGSYRKGNWVFNQSAKIWIQNVTAICANEDINSDGLLDKGEDINSNGILDEGEDLNGDGVLDKGEDTNSNGELTPGIFAVVSYKDGKHSSDENGQATVQLRYPKNYAAWTEIVVSVFGSSSGSEARANTQLVLPILAADVTNEFAPPPENAFGETGNCQTID